MYAPDDVAPTLPGLLRKLGCRVDVPQPGGQPHSYMANTAATRKRRKAGLAPGSAERTRKENQPSPSYLDKP